jgi:hypothetical protein
MISFTQSWLWAVCCVGMVIGSVAMGLNSAIYRQKQGFNYALFSFLVTVLIVSMYTSISLE